MLFAIFDLDRKAPILLLIKDICQLKLTYISREELWCKIGDFEIDSFAYKENCWQSCAWKCFCNLIKNVQFSYLWFCNFFWKWALRCVVTQKTHLYKGKKMILIFTLFWLVILSTNRHSTNEILEFVDKSFSFLSSTVRPCVLLNQLVELDFPELLDSTLMKVVIG